MESCDARRSGTWSVKTMRANCACGSRKMSFVALKVSCQLWVCCPLPVSFAFFLRFGLRWRMRWCWSLTVS